MSKHLDDLPTLSNHLPATETFRPPPFRVTITFGALGQDACRDGASLLNAGRRLNLRLGKISRAPQKVDRRIDSQFHDG